MLGFECDCSVDHDAMPRVQDSTIRRARKPHTCVECGRTIAPGERYEVYSGIGHDGDPFRDSTCLGCYRIRERWCAGGWFRGGVAEQVQECLGFDYRDDPDEWDQQEVDEEDEEHRQYIMGLKERASRKQHQ